MNTNKLIKEYSLLVSKYVKFNNEFSLFFTCNRGHNLLSSKISEIRKICKTDDQKDLRYIMQKQINQYYSNYKKIKEYNRQKPRVTAQKFIGKKNIRQLIFKRDKYRCLNCGETNNLQLDHIIPVNKGGKNNLMNLQTLCRSCNSKKSDKYKDYR